MWGTVIPVAVFIHACGCTHRHVVLHRVMHVAYIHTCGFTVMRVGIHRIKHVSVYRAEHVGEMSCVWLYIESYKSLYSHMSGLHSPLVVNRVTYVVVQRHACGCTHVWTRKTPFNLVYFKSRFRNQKFSCSSTRHSTESLDLPRDA
jgi:hypothetical protein